MKDTDTVASIGAMAAGTVVKPKRLYDEKNKLIPVLPIPEIYGNLDLCFGHAIVVSMSPFTLVSERGHLRWCETVKQENFDVVGIANEETMAICNTRIAD